MAIEVRIPTILRPYTGGERAVDGAGATVAELIDQLEVDHPGIKERLVENDEVRRFVNIYVNDEDIRFTGGLDTPVADGNTVVILPAVAGGASRSVAHALRLADRLRRRHPARRAPQALAEPGRTAVGEARGPEPDRLDQGSCRAGDDPQGRGRGTAQAWRDDPRAHQRQHRHLAGDGGEPARLQADLRHAREHLDRAHPAADDVGRRDHPVAGGGRIQRGRTRRQEDSPPSIPTG